MNFKVKTPRDSKYLKWLSTQPCCRCGGNYGVVGHHTSTGGTSLKGSDYEAVPLCFYHHAEHDNKRKDAIPNLKAIIAALLTKYEREKL